MGESGRCSSAGAYEIQAAGADETLWQTFAVLLPVKSVGVIGDVRTYENAYALCILVASPRLFDAQCRSPQQMQWANGLCRYAELARVP